MTRDALVWVRSHIPWPLGVLLAVAVALEILVGAVPLVLPWVPALEAQWGLLLPLFTAAVLVQMLYSGLDRMERPLRRSWRGPRAAWGALVVVTGMIPAFWAADGLETPGSLRNRGIILGVTVLASLALPVSLAVLPAFVLLLTAMLVRGSDGPAWAGGFLMDPSATPLGGLLTAILLALAVVLYAGCHPGSRLREGLT